MKVEMKTFLLFALASSIFCVAIANDILTGGLQLQEPCFPVFEASQCNETLLDSYQPENPKIGANEPDTKFFLFTPTNPDKAEQLHLCGGKLPPNSAYDPQANTELFIHGWLDGNCKTGWMREMKEQLFIRGNYNVILVDWSWGNTIDYFAASQNCKIVGEQVGFVINNIMNQKGVSGKKFHIIGHSYGAVAGGFAGRKLRELSGQDLRRVTGLDPAFPAKKDEPLNQTLTHEDAEIVDMIHSNSGQCHLFFIGDSRPLGHADFYPEGGEFQTSCYPYMLESFLKSDFFYAVSSLSPTLCSHLQSLQFYKLSINPGNCEFIGVECDSQENLKSCVRSGESETAVMGMNFEKYYQPSNKRPRKYYLHVKDYCSYIDNRYLEKGNYPSNLTCSGEP